jgi:hypothetical protein
LASAGRLSEEEAQASKRSLENEAQDSQLVMRMLHHFLEQGSRTGAATQNVPEDPQEAVSAAAMHVGKDETAHDKMQRSDMMQPLVAELGRSSRPLELLQACNQVAADRCQLLEGQAAAATNQLQPNMDQLGDAVTSLEKQASNISSLSVLCEPCGALLIVVGNPFLYAAHRFSSWKWWSISSALHWSASMSLPSLFDRAELGAPLV